jgi:hypothetical protein
MALKRQQTVPRSLRTLFHGGTFIGLTDGQLLERFALRDVETAEATIMNKSGSIVSTLLVLAIASIGSSAFMPRGDELQAAAALSGEELSEAPKSDSDAILGSLPRNLPAGGRHPDRMFPARSRDTSHGVCRGQTRRDTRHLSAREIRRISLDQTGCADNLVASR